MNTTDHSTLLSTPLTTSALRAGSALAAVSGLASSLFGQETTPPATPKSTTEVTEVDVEAERDTGRLTSPKFTAPIRDTPQTVVVVPSEVYLQQGAVTLSDVLRNTPGITFLAGEGGNAAATGGDAFYMRGFDASSNIFIDGVRDVGSYSRDVYNTESVEAAKGTGGTDIGRGAATGYLNIVTKRAQATNFGSGTVAIGFDEVTSGTTQRATLDVNRSIAQSPIKGTALRLNLMAQDSDVLGREVAESKAWGFSPSLSLGLGTPLRVHLSYQREEHNNIPDYGMPTPAFPGYTSSPMPPAIDHTTFYGFTSDFDDTVHEAAGARLEYDVSADFVLSNQTRYSGVQRQAIVTTPGNSTGSYAPATGLQTRSRQGNKRDTDVFTNQTNLAGSFATGKVTHDISAGLEFIRETAYQPAFASVTLTAIPVQSPNPSATPSGTPARSGAWTDAQIDTTAFYVFDTAKLGEKWLINGGARMDHYATDYVSVATTGVATTANAKDEVYSWKGGLVFKPVPAASIYASYGLSQRPPGTDFTLSTAAGNQNNPSTVPQETTNTELGVKWDLFKGRLQATAAVFKTVNDNTVFTDPILGAVATGQQTVQGAEVGLSGRINDAWLVYGGAAFLDAEVNTGTTAQVSYGLPLIPEVSGNIWTTYRINPKVTVGGGANYQGETNRLQNTTGVGVTMPAYWLVNATASYQVNPSLTFRANINNLLDEDYVNTFNNNGGRFTFGAPRTYQVTAEFKF